MFEPGTIIQNRYEIIEEVGTGGMSVVYKAKCHVLNRYVAIKVLKPEFADDKSFVSKFRVEAQSAAGLSHPNIVNVYDVGEENGYYYIVMELVEGITLKEYIQQNGRLPYATALNFITQICSGIEAAHEHHTIHRDIKPQNIIVSKNGTLKVTDFGIAKAATSNTIASSAMGSVHYISPEQARGGYSDERSDIYSLGITLYEMLTGRVPFEGENNVTVALMHIQSEIIPPREYYPDIPVGIERIVLKATQKKPERRYLTTSAMLADLKKIALDPNANVGITNTMVSDSAPTIQISEDELSAINNATGRQEGISMFPVDQPRRNSELEEANTELEKLYNESEYEDDDDEDEYDDDDDVFDEKDDKDSLDPKMEKLITIGAIAATVLIAIILIVAVVSISDIGKKKNATTEAASSTEATADTMISVVNMDEEEATEALDKAGIAYEIEREYSDTFEEGKVISQSIEEGTKLKEDDRVKLIISKGQEMVDVPDVTGKTSDEAQTTLTAAGFKVEIDEENDDEVEEGKVISQTPEGNGKAAKKSTVTIVVSKGKEVKVVEVPDLKKMSIKDAEKALSDAKLKLGNVNQEYSDTIKEGLVITQSVEAGVEVKEGAEVSITISKGKKPDTTQASKTTYKATFSGSISNSSYSFPEGGQIKVTVKLQADGKTHVLVQDYYDEASLPLDGSSFGSITGIKDKSNISLVYSVQDANGNDITGNFSSTLQASLKAE